MQYTLPKGVFDIYPRPVDPEEKWKDSFLWAHFEALVREICPLYGFGEIRTPVFEKSELFLRSIGEASDIVMKEMYTFMDKGERSLTLRPEGTASVARSFIENRLYQTDKTPRYFYMGPMFRYERPQQGRYRQHHQFGAEAYGVKEPEQEAETIHMLLTLYRRLNLKNLRLMINSVGDEGCRERYKTQLKAYLAPHLNQLSEDSKIRFERNVLRILDSKDPQDQEVLRKAPLILDALSPEAKAHFEMLQKYLHALGIPFEVCPQLVRGLDYYNRTVFEITSGELGAQNTIGAGGRYDNLIKSLGGPDMPAFGFATGIERIILTWMRQNEKLPRPTVPLLYLVPMETEMKPLCLELAEQIRSQGGYVEIDWSTKKVPHALQIANALQARFFLVVGADELSRKTGFVKNLASRESHEMALSDVPQFVLHPR